MSEEQKQRQSEEEKEYEQSSSEEENEEDSDDEEYRQEVEDQQRRFFEQFQQKFRQLLETRVSQNQPINEQEQSNLCNRFFQELGSKMQQKAKDDGDSLDIEAQEAVFQAHIEAYFTPLFAPPAPKKKTLRLGAASFKPTDQKPQEQQQMFDNSMMMMYNQPFWMNQNNFMDQFASMNDGFEEGTFTRRPLKITESKNKQKKQEKEKTEKEKQLMKQKREEKILISKVERKKKDAEGVQKKKEQKKKKVEKQEDLDVENLDTNVFSEVDETRQPVNIVFIGHVDAGKSTICGNILLMTGKVDSKDLRKFQMEAKEKNRDSWYLAYIMDINEEERSKGKTVEVGKAHFETVSKRFTILDAPGHKNYVPNMIQGASQADIAAMVISAKKGEFEAGFEKGGQTREHAMLARSLGVRFLVLVINKMDEIEWSEERYKYIQQQTMPFLTQNCGYTEEDVAWCPITGLFGDNIVEPLDKNKCPWYKGPSLMELLDKAPMPIRDSNAELRIPVLDKMKDQGQFIFGKLESGQITTNQSLIMMPGKIDFQVTHIYNSQDQRVLYAKAGENVKLKIKGIEDVDIEKGYIACNPENLCPVCYEVEAKIQVLELPEHKQIMCAGYTCVLHMHTAIEEIEIKAIVSFVDEKGEVKKSSFLKSNMTGTVRIICKNYLMCEKYQTNLQLGSFTLRDEQNTIALGQITRLKPVKKEVEEVTEDMKKQYEELKLKQSEDPKEQPKE